MADFIIFGGTGQQGRICAKDLLENGYSVLLAGRDNSKIKELLKNKNAEFIYVDLKNNNSIIDAIKKSKAKVVVNCAELVYNVPIMKACLKMKRSLTDLGGLQKITKEQFKLDNSFKKKGIACITGCGSTPGISNILTAHALEEFETIETIELGFSWNSNLKAFVVPYSIQSIFSEFSEPPIIFHNGKFIKSNRIRCQGTFNFREVGKQTCYCIVHSEVYTFAKYFKSKGIKNINYMAGFPEHSLIPIKTMIDLGFASKKPIKIEGKNISPVEFTTQMLKKIRIPENYKETENIWVKLHGKKAGKEKKAEINCIVKTLDDWKEAGSNVDTGRTISIISQMLFNGYIEKKGVFAPEAHVPHEHFLKELSKRQMFVYLNGKRIN